MVVKWESHVVAYVMGQVLNMLYQFCQTSRSSKCEVQTLTCHLKNLLQKKV